MTLDSGYTLVLTGDTSLGDLYLRRAASEVQHRLAERPMSFFDELRPLVEDADLFVTNFESVLADNPTSPFEGEKKYLGWDSPERTAEALTHLGVDAVSLANNHTMDFGPDVLAATSKTLHTVGIASFGAGAGPADAGAPLVRTLAAGAQETTLYILGAVTDSAALRERYGFFADEERWGLHPLSGQRIAAQIADLRSADPDAVILLYPHWGANYGWASAGMARHARRYLEAGADMIIGHGAHMCQELTTTPRGSIVYSIGNFVFNSPGRYARSGAWPYSLVARLTFLRRRKRWYVDARLYPIVTDNKATDYQGRPVNESEARAVYASLAARSEHPASFGRSYALEQDERGWYLRQTTAISPRLRAASRMSIAGWRRRRLISADCGEAAERKATETGPETSSRNPPAKKFREGSTAGCIAAALDAREIYWASDHVTLNGKVRRALRCTINEIDYAVHSGVIYRLDNRGVKSGTINHRTTQFAGYKERLATHLEDRGFSVPRGRAFYAVEIDASLDYFDSHESQYADGFCIKPVMGKHGENVITSVISRAEFRAGFSQVAATNPRVLVQEMRRGVVYRFLCVGDTVSAIRTGIPMNVTGDGSSNIAELVDTKREARASDPAHSLFSFELGDSERYALLADGLSPNSVPAPGVRVYLSETSNLHRGADCADYTDAVHPSHKHEVQRAVASIPGMRLCGADVLIRDHTAPADMDNHVVLELNRYPGIGGHHYPWVGTPRDAAGDIVDLMCRLTPADHD